MKKLIVLMVVLCASVAFAGPPCPPPTPLTMDNGGIELQGNINLNGYWLSGDGDDEGVYVDSDGYVGIGTSTPGLRLDIADEVDNSSIAVLNDVTGLKISNSSIIPGHYSILRLMGRGGLDGVYIRGLDEGNNLTALEFGEYTNGGNTGTTYMSVDPGGNVGVGTTSPDANLHIEEDTTETATAVEIQRLSVTSTGTPAAGLGPKIVAEVETAAAHNEETAFISFPVSDVTDTSEDGMVQFGTMKAGSAATVDMTIKDGYVGIGTDSPSAQLHFTGGLVVGSESVTCGDGTNSCTYSAAYHTSYYTTDDDADGADVVTVTDASSAETIRRFVLKTDGGDDLAITPTNFANGTTVTLDTAGESVTLGFDGANWYIICHYGGVVS